MDVEAETRAYYRARAAEYEQWYTRTGRYARGPAEDAVWRRDLRAAEDFVRPLRGQRVFEIACGTGWWTRRLAATNRVTASDHAAETLAESRASDPPGATLPRCRADAYRLPLPASSFDAAFFGFWLSHVPVPRAAEFMREAARIVRPGGHLWLVDSRQDPSHGARDQSTLGSCVQTQRRRLNDGREFRVWKVYWSPADLRFLFGLVCRDVEIYLTDRFFSLTRGAVV